MVLAMNGVRPNPPPPATSKPGLAFAFEFPAAGRLSWILDRGAVVVGSRDRAS